MRISVHALAKRWYAYQHKRFPMGAVTLGLLPAVLSSVAIIGSGQWTAALSAFVAALAYLFHIRAIDEVRDFDHDNVHHAERPVQVGLITRTELRVADRVGVVVILILAALAGPTALIAALIMLSYSLLCEREFFAKTFLRRRFYLYNAVNLVQMLILQAFIYLYLGAQAVTAALAIHFLFTGAGSALLEYVRKVKSPGFDGTGADTYSHHLGFLNSLIIYSILLVAQSALFVLLAQSGRPLLTGLFFAILALLSACIYARSPSKGGALAFQGMYLLAYAVQNLVIFYALY